MLRVFANDRLMISVTDNCNFNCKYCTNEGQPHNRGNFINLFLVEQIADFIINKKIYIKKLNITGGEPLLHPKLIEIIKALKKTTENITLNTNGELLNKRVIIELKEAGINCIKFGIDSFFQKTTKPFCRNCSCNPERIISNLFFARKIIPRSSVNIVLTDFNYHEFWNILNFCISNEIDLVEFLELINFDFRGQNKILRNGIKFADVFWKYKTVFKQISYNLKLGKYLCETHNGLIMQFADDFCRSRVCRNLWTRMDSKGNLIPCIKSNDKFKIDLKQFLNQITMNNNLMCESIINKNIVRTYKGELLTGEEQGEYYPSYVSVIRDNAINFLDLDL